jgi:Leucine-rich repeat (LRR) protein
MPHADPSLSIAERVDAACDRFEAEWKAGSRPRIEDYLAAVPESDRQELRQALVAIELELQGRGLADTSVSQSSVRSDDKVVPVMTVDHVTGSPQSSTTVGRFEIRGILGSGAFGKVYRAFDPQLGREVALKVPLESAVESDAERSQFLKEARAAATINHPNVCQIHEVGEHAGRPYIVMALVPGQSLAEALKARKEPMTEKQTVLIVRKVAQALAAAHGKGIVHRDLKPANIMFDRERKDIVVMDFGLARGPKVADARATQSGVIMGTPAYMSPEQARGESKAVGPAGDVFSLGVILYELLTGTRPFAGTATEVIGQILHVDPDPPSKRRPSIDPRLEAVCLKAMAKDPAARFTTMKEFAAAIDAVLRAPQPTGPAAETAKAQETRQNTEPAGTKTLGEVFAALSADRKQARAETAAAVEAAIARHRTPRWVFVLAGLLLVGGLTALGSIIFFTRSDKVSVTIELTDVDLADKTLSFFLDEEPISAEALAKPIELKPGEHVLVVKRGKEIVKRMLLTVTGGRSPGLKYRDITPPPASPPPSKEPDRTAAEWALRRGAVVVVKGSEEKRVTAVDQLPTARFQLIGVAFPTGFDVGAASGLGPLKALTHLRELSLFNAKLNDGDLRPIEGMASVRSLNLHGAPVTDAVMASIATLPNLEELWLHYRPITDEGIAKIAGLKKLKKLLLRRTNIGPDGLKVIGGFTDLEHLDVGGTRVIDDSLAHLTGLRKLRHLEIEGTPLTGSGLRHLADLPALEILSIGDGAFAGNGSITDGGLQALGGLKGLHELAIDDSTSGRLTDVSLEVVGKLNGLEALSVAIPGTTDAGITPLKNLTNLSRLRLRGPKITDGGLMHLGPLYRLRALELSRTAVTGAGMKHLTKLGQLSSLSFPDCPITDAGLADVASLKALEELNLARTKVTDEGLGSLAKHAGLKYVHLTGCPVSIDGLRRLKAALPDCKITP